MAAKPQPFFRPGCVLNCGRIGQGEVMGRFGDLPFGVQSHLVLIAQPKNFVGRTKESFLFSSDPSLNLTNISFGKMVEVIDSLLELKDLVHVTSLHCSSDNGGKPIHFGPDCGGLFKFSQGEKSAVGFHDARFIKIGCGRCDMFLEAEGTLEKFSNVVFHLAMKQMMPDLETLNFVYCSDFNITDQLFSAEKDYWQQVKNLGTISVATELMRGHIGDGYHDGGWNKKFALGFMAIPGLNTGLNFDGMDRWVNVLVLKKFKQLEAFRKNHLSFLIGPKPSTKS